MRATLAVEADRCPPTCPGSSPTGLGATAPGRRSNGRDAVSPTETSPAAARSAGPPVDDASGSGNHRLRHETRVAMLGETLQLANYSAVTQAAVAVALAYMFWDIAAHAYLLGLAGAVTLLCALTVAAARRYRGTFGAGASEHAVRRGFAVSKLLAFALGLSWASLPAVLLPGMDNAYRVILVAVCAGLVSDAYVVGPIFGVAFLLAAPVVAGLFVGLLGCEAPVGQYIAILLAVYAAFVFLSARRMCRLSCQRLWDRAVVQEQSETIGLLLKDFEEGASDWLWETDGTGRLHHSRRRFAGLLGRDREDLEAEDLNVLAVLREFAAEGRPAGTSRRSLRRSRPGCRSATSRSAFARRRGRAGGRSTGNPPSTGRAPSSAIAASAPT